MDTKWKDEKGHVDIGMTVFLSSTGWHKDASASDEEEREDSRKIIEIDIGGTILSAHENAELFEKIAPLIQAEVDSVSPYAIDWEADE